MIRLRFQPREARAALRPLFVLLLVFLVVSVAQGDIVPQDSSPTPAQQYRAIQMEYEKAASGTGTSDEDRRRSIARVDALREGLARKFLELAEKYPNDPIAVDALVQAVWMVNGNPFPSDRPGGPGDRAMTLLLRDHVQSEKVGPICLRVANGFRREYEPFLRTILEKNPHKSAQALACLALAQYLNDRSKRLEQIKKQPDALQKYQKLFGREYLAALQRKDRRVAVREVERLFERARDVYGEEKIPYEGTVRAKASAELFELQYLNVGRAAPEITGLDQDGKPFKLSDYRGKIVLLDFWNKY